MKFLLFVLASVFIVAVLSTPVVPPNYQVVCLQFTKACKFDGSCSNDQTRISRILDQTGLSFSDFIMINPLLGEILPSGSVSDNQMVCVSGIWQGQFVPTPSPAANSTV